MKTWWLYLLECEGDRLYAGVAIDVAARFELHRTGKGARFTRANRPKIILAAQPFETRGDALRAEYALKQLERSEKLQWAARWPFLPETEDRIVRNTKRAMRSGKKKEDLAAENAKKK